VVRRARRCSPRRLRSSAWLVVADQSGAAFLSASGRETGGVSALGLFSEREPQQRVNADALPAAVLDLPEAVGQTVRALAG